MQNTNIGEKIKSARQRQGLSMQKLIDIINTDPDRPQPEKLLLFDRYKSWEYGKNAIPSSWIPTLCKHLLCDAGYLFGEYEELTRQKVSMCAETGLSEPAIDALLGIYKYGPTNSLKALDTILQHEQMWKFLGRREETISGINLLWHIGQYLSDERAQSHYLVYIDSKMGYPEKQTEISTSNYITHGEPLAALYDRAILDTINDALKQIRKDRTEKP